MRESLGMGVLDSACTRTVTGETLLKCFFYDTLSDSDKDLVRTSSVNTKFRFGDGVEVMSLL